MRGKSLSLRGTGLPSTHSYTLAVMTHVVTESCIRCKYTDCVDVCPVDCFREGPNFLAIDPDEGVGVPTSDRWLYATDPLLTERVGTLPSAKLELLLTGIDVVLGRRTTVA